MSEVYTQKQKDIIQLLLARMFKKSREKRLSLRGLSERLGAQPATILRWRRAENWPDGYHVYMIKKFLGYLQ